MDLRFLDANNRVCQNRTKGSEHYYLMYAGTERLKWQQFLTNVDEYVVPLVRNFDSRRRLIRDRLQELIYEVELLNFAPFV